MPTSTPTVQVGSESVSCALCFAQVALFVLLRRLKFSLHSGHVVTPKAKIILTPANGVVMDYKDRAR